MKSNSLNRFLSLVSLAALVTSLAVLPAHGAEKRFLDDGDSKHKDEPQEFLKDYDKLVKGKGADWVFFDAHLVIHSVPTMKMPNIATAVQLVLSAGAGAAVWACAKPLASNDAMGKEKNFFIAWLP